MKPKHALQMRVRALGWTVPPWLLDSATREMRKLADTLSANDIVLDLGAHVGNATTEFAKRAKHVHAFEPNPANFAKLSSQTRRYPNVTLYQKAVSDHNETADLYFEKSKPGKFFEGATIMKNKSNITYENRVEVEALDIAAFIEGLNQPITCIKMDIEGAEYRVLERLLDTGRIHDVERVLVECHVDRIPELAGDKARVLAKAAELGVLDKLDFDWQ